MIKQIVLELGPWAWIILGLLLLVLEIIAPGTLFLWFGIAALLVGGASFLFDIGWQNAFILFGVLSLISVIVGRMILSRTASNATDRPMLNQRAQALVGKTYRLDEPLENGHGRVKVHDSYWQIVGPDCPAGSKIEITGANGTVLEAKPAE